MTNINSPAAHASAAYLTLEELKTRYSDPESRYVDIGGVQIRYKDEGSGPAILLMHGSKSSLDGFDGLASSLRKDYRVIRLDMPGMGLSGTLPNTTKTSTPFIDDIMRGLLDHLKVERAIILGTSSGGTASYFFAARFPQRVQALILSNTPADPIVMSNIPRTPELLEQFEEADLTGFKSRDYWNIYLKWLHGPDSKIDAAWIERYYDMNRRKLGPNLHSFWRLTSSFPEPYIMLAQVRAPTLLIWGQHDFVLPLSKMDSLKDHLPATQVSSVILDGIGHYPPFEVPDRFARIVRTYVETIVADHK